MNAMLEVSVKEIEEWEVTNDGIFAEEEKLMIRECCKEMEIPLFDVETAKQMNEIIEVFKNSDLHIKNSYVRNFRIAIFG